MDTYIRFVLKRPIWVLAIFSLITLALLPGLFKLKFDTSIATFLPQSDPEYLYYEKVKEIYGDSDTFVILSVTRQNLWTYETFKKIDALLEDLEAFQTIRPVLEKKRHDRLTQMLLQEGIRPAQLLAHFNTDPLFQRLLERKLRRIDAGEGPMSSRMRRKLAAAVDATRELKDRTMISDIISPFTIKDISGENDTLTTFTLIDTDADGSRILPETVADFATFRAKLFRNPVFERGVYAVDDHGNITDFGIIIRFSGAWDSDPMAREILEIVDSHDGLDIVAQGQPVVYIWISNYMQKDLIRLVPLVLLVTVVIFFINFKSARGVVLPFSTLTMATVWILGLMGHLGFAVTTIGISIPVLMIAVGSSYSIHILNQYYADYGLISSVGKAEGLRQAMGHISVTVILSGLTTIVSFLTLSIHPLEALREWGFFCGVGILFAVLISISVIPAGLKLMTHGKNGTRFSKKAHPGATMIDSIIALLTKYSLYHYKTVMVVIMVLLGVSLAGLMRLNVETELLQFFKKDNEIRKTAGIISDKFGGRWGFNILIDSGQIDGVKCPEYLGHLSSFRSWLVCGENADLCVGRTDAFTDIVKTMHMAMNNDDPLSFAVPESRMDIMDYLEIYADEDADSDGRADSMEAYVDPEFRTCNVLTRLGQNGQGSLGTAELKQVFSEISRYLDRALPPGYSFKITGHPFMLIKSADYVVNGQIQSLVLALVIISIVVLFLIKDIRAAMLSMIPVSVAVMINFGLMGWLGIRLDIATSTIAAITIGIGVDATIHFLNNLRYQLHRGESMDTAIAHTIKNSGKAILFTSMALIFGFAVLLLSTFKPLIQFGVLMAVTMTATTVGALLVLPCAIKLTNIQLIRKEAAVSNKSLVPAFLRGALARKG